MKKIRSIVSLSLLLGSLLFAGCSEENNTMPSVSAMAYELDQSGTGNEIVVPVGTDVVYAFEVESEAELKLIEIWKYEGVDIDKSAPVIQATYEYPSVQIGNTFSFKDTIEDLQEDVRYSIYVQDMNDSHTSAQANMLLDVTRYSASLTDGMSNGTSPTFLNVESGRSLFVANTIADPEGIDFGFAYLEGEESVLASLVSFHEYYKTGNYAMVVNDNNNATQFKDASALGESFEHIYDAVDVAGDLESYFNSAADLPAPLDFVQGAIAPQLETGHIIAFRTEDARHGLLQVTAVDDKGGSLSNDQTIDFDVIVEKKYETN